MDLSKEAVFGDIQRRCAATPIESTFVFLPSQFDLSEISFLYPTEKKPMSSLAAMLSIYAPRTVLTFLPPLLQMNQGIFWTLRAAHIPEISMPPRNPEAALSVIEQLHTEGIVATMETARILQESPYADKLRTVRFWHIIVPLGEHAQNTTVRFGSIHRDIHLMPGVSIAYQCGDLSPVSRFHPTPEFAWEEDAGQLSVHSIDDRPVWIPKVAIARGRILVQDRCACGADTTLELL